MAFFRILASVLFLFCSFVLMNVGLVAYAQGSEPLGWALIVAGLAGPAIVAILWLYPPKYWHWPKSLPISLV